MTLDELDCPVLPQVYVTLDELDCPVLKLRFPPSGICDLRRIRLSCTKTKVPLPQVYVTLDELDCPVLKLRFSSLRYM